MSNHPLQRPPPADEPARLVAVRSHEMPEGMPELAFDATARLAATCLAAPVAFVALTDATRLWFKASVGIDLQRLERELAQCAQAIVQADGLLAIDDLRLHPLLQANPLVTGEPRLRSYAGAPMLDATGQAIGMLGVLDVQPRAFGEAQRQSLRDLASVASMALQARREAAELARQTRVDPLTGAANRKQFDAALLAELHHAMRKGEPFTLLLLGLDGFADIRNGFGAVAADAALREVSARLARQVRLGDLLARLEGEEFGVVMRHGAQAEAEVLAARIVEAVRQPLMLDSADTVGVRVCIGIAAYSDSVESVADLLGQAGQALQQARRQHERRWNFFGRKFEAPTLRLVAGDETAASA